MPKFRSQMPQVQRTRTCQDLRTPQSCVGLRGDDADYPGGSGASDLSGVDPVLGKAWWDIYKPTGTGLPSAALVGAVLGIPALLPLLAGAGASFLPPGYGGLVDKINTVGSALSAASAAAQQREVKWPTTEGTTTEATTTAGGSEATSYLLSPQQSGIGSQLPGRPPARKKRVSRLRVRQVSARQLRQLLQQ